MATDALEEKNLIRFMQAVGSESRFRIVQLLLTNETLCVGAIACRLDITQSAVSQHLRILEEAGVVGSERMGMRVHYQVDRELLGSSLALIREALTYDSGDTAEQPAICSRRKHVQE
jgi:ArsR family transcriptional regulator